MNIPKNQKYLYLIVTGFMLFAILQSCSTTDSNGTSKKLVSSFNSSRSHNTGQDCMNCHVSGGGGDGLFSIAGTVYNKSGSSVLPNSIVRIYSSIDMDSDPVLIVEVDAKGNFYTTENLVFGDGLYVSVEGPTTETSMEASISTGSCSSCHGKSTERVWGE